MSSSCSRGESLQSPVLIPPDALDALIYIVEKKLTELPVEGPSTAAWLPDELSHDSTSGRKRAEKYTRRLRSDAACQERAEEFSNPYQNTQLCPPLTLVCEHH